MNKSYSEDNLFIKTLSQKYRLAIQANANNIEIRELLENSFSAYAEKSLSPESSPLVLKILHQLCF